ncbi:sulfatase-like hydrolase/transferase [Streptomyces sp. NPDC001552]|uniref:sulfatase-like hydrolase/transferase n=1 Tax=Streptomyces sp. NPDC001552 TaxID=3364587 RepID=UPI00369A5DA6
MVVLADDLGYGDLGAYGQELIATPHIDRLAAEGLWFTHAYSAAAVCAPSRAALLTGLHTNHAAVVRANPAAGGQGSLAAGDTTLEVLRAGLPYGLVRQAGLRTGGRREQRAGRPVLPPRAGQPRVRGLDDGGPHAPGAPATPIGQDTPVPPMPQ